VRRAAVEHDDGARCDERAAGTNDDRVGDRVDGDGRVDDRQRKRAAESSRSMLRVAVRVRRGGGVLSVYVQRVVALSQGVSRQVQDERGLPVATGLTLESLLHRRPLRDPEPWQLIAGTMPRIPRFSGGGRS
jgi:hypothetical protein